MAQWGKIPTLVYKVEYTNWRGETSIRTFRFHHLFWGSSEWHPEPQWLVKGFDYDKQDYRDYALKDMRMVEDDE